MNFPKYWAQEEISTTNPAGKTIKLACWGWSDRNEAEARLVARQRAEQAAQAFSRGQPLRQYTGYSNRPLREEIIDRLETVAGQPSVVITRNRYGALVLNTAEAMFIDIDFPQELVTDDGAEVNPDPTDAPPPPSLLDTLLGRPPKPTATQAPPTIWQVVERWAAQNPNVGLRAYRTHSGLRCLITTEVFDPTAASTQQVLQEFGSDPLYIKLCQSQACFRARLTPKPWRCNGMGGSYPAYPWPTLGEEHQARKWEQRYERTSGRYATCRLIQEFGPQQYHPAIARIVAWHDEQTRVGQRLPLA